MSTSRGDVVIPSREQFGLPPIDDVRREPRMPELADPKTVQVPAKQLDRIMAAIAALETRMDASDRRNGELRAPPIPEPDPPYDPPLHAHRAEQFLRRNPAPPVGQPPPQGPDPYGPPRPFHTGYPPGQPDYQQYRRPYAGNEGLGQWDFHQWQQPQLPPPPHHNQYDHAPLALT